MCAVPASHLASWACRRASSFASICFSFWSRISAASTRASSAFFASAPVNSFCLFSAAVVASIRRISAKFSELEKLTESLDNALTPGPQQDVACADLANTAYRKACALLEFSADAACGLLAEGSTRPEPIEGWVMDVIRLEVEKIQLAGKMLYNLAHDAPKTK